MTFRCQVSRGLARFKVYAGPAASFIIAQSLHSVLLVIVIGLAHEILEKTASLYPASTCYSI